MFRWLKIKNTDSVMPEENAFDHLKTQTLTKTIQTLSGVTPNDFQRLYVTAIDRFVQYAGIPNQPTDEFVVESLNRVVLALKKRQGYLLPLGSDSELAFRQREEWTYAVFSAALSRSIDVAVRMAVMKALLPTQAYAWLHRNTLLFSLWERYLHDDTNNNVLAEIVGNHADLGVEAVKQATTLSESTHNQAYKDVRVNVEYSEPQLEIAREEPNEIAIATEARSDAQSSVESLDEMTSIKEIHLNALSDESATIAGSAQSDNEVSATTKLHDDSQTLLADFSASDFWRWLKHGIRIKELTWNQEKSFLHGVEEGLLICIPQAIDAFLSDQAKTQSIDLNTLLLRQRPSLTKCIKKEGVLIRNAKGSRIHAYCRGKWEDRHTLSGIVVEADFLTAKNTIIPVDPQLIVDPLSTV